MSERGSSSFGIIAAFVVTLSSFALFAVEFAIGKQLLPAFGGSVFVWTTALVFFTTMLALGYAYVYAIRGMPSPRRERFHSRVLVTLGGLQVASAFLIGFGMYPFAWFASLPAAPWVQVWLALACSVGPGFLALATTAPLVQFWYARVVRSEPYHLYALSNAGSFAALGAYPFLIEPSLTLSVQRAWWLGFVIVLLAGSVVLAHVAGRENPGEKEADTVGEAVPARRAAEWFWYAALASALLVAVTAQLTQVIASLPLVWMVPLGLYLVSFVLAFAGRGEARWLAPLAFVVLAGSFAVYLPGFTTAGASRQLLVYLVMFFIVSWYLHAQVYERRATRALPLFYLCIALGGALGTFAVGIGAPLFVPGFLEFPFLLSAAIATVAVYICLPASMSRLLRGAVRAALAGMALYAGFFALTHDARGSIHESRTPYGTVSVWERDGVRFMTHGTTIHGAQYEDEARAQEPLSYYGRGTGVGRAILFAQTIKSDEPVKIGIIGLGTGSVAAYCRPGDLFTFYEIDPRIEEVAREHFSYLERCSGASVRVGDGRLLLERELRESRGEAYDVLVVDAFSDDIVPTHLLTQEAFATYLRHLSLPRGVLAVHVSNRFIDIAGVVARYARDAGLPSIHISTDGDAAIHAYGSQWVLITLHEGTFAPHIFALAASPAPEPVARAWTDERIDLIRALRLPQLLPAR